MKVSDIIKYIICFFKGHKGEGIAWDEIDQEGIVEYKEGILCFRCGQIKEKGRP